MLTLIATLESPANYKKDNETLFVDAAKKKKRNHKYNTGFEYDQDVKTDGDFIEKIIKSNNYNPTSENTIDFDDELRRIIVKNIYFSFKPDSLLPPQQSMTQTTDKRTVGSIIGATVFGLAGFLLLSFTVIGALAGKFGFHKPVAYCCIGGVLGVAVGRYAGKKMTKTFKKNKKITEEDFFRIKLQCLLKWGKMQKDDQANNLNLYRMSLEKVNSRLICSIMIDLKPFFIDHRGVFSCVGPVCVLQAKRNQACDH